MLEIDYIEGDATAPKAEGNKVIVHVCNDVGGWGRGFVTALSKRWPEPEARYRAWHRGEVGGEFALGAVQLVQVEDDLWVANLVAQRGMRAKTGSEPAVRYEAIREGMRRIREHARELDASLHMPRIGCGLAGGRWEEIEPILAEECTRQGVAVTVYDLPTR